MIRFLTKGNCNITSTKRVFHSQFVLKNSTSNNSKPSSTNPQQKSTPTSSNAADRSLEELFAKDFPNLSKLKKESPQTVQALNNQAPISVDTTWNPKYIPSGALLFYIALLVPAMMGPVFMSNAMTLTSLNFIYGFVIKYTNIILFTGAATHVALAFAGYGPHSLLRKLGNAQQKSQMERLDQEMREKGTNNFNITNIWDNISLNPYAVNSKSALLRYIAAFFFAILCSFTISFPHEEAGLLPIVYTIAGNVALLLFDSAMTKQGLTPFWYTSLKGVVVAATIVLLISNYFAYAFYKPSHDKKLYEAIQQKEIQEKLKRKVN